MKLTDQFEDDSNYSKEREPIGIDPAVRLRLRQFMHRAAGEFEQFSGASFTSFIDRAITVAETELWGEDRTPKREKKELSDKDRKTIRELTGGS